MELDSKNIENLLQRLEKIGIELNLIPRFIKDLANSLFVNPNMNFSQANERLHYIGWNDIRTGLPHLPISPRMLRPRQPKRKQHKVTTTQKEVKVKVIYEMQYDDNAYEYEGVTKIDHETNPNRIKGYKNDELIFDIDRGLLKSFHTIE